MNDEKKEGAGLAANALSHDEMSETTQVDPVNLALDRHGEEPANDDLRDKAAERLWALGCPACDAQRYVDAVLAVIQVRDDEAADAARDSAGLSTMLSLIDDSVRGGSVARMQRRFVNFVALSWVAGAPFARGGLRDIAEGLNISHEAFRQRVEAMKRVVHFAHTPCLPDHHLAALDAARERRAA